MTRSLSAEETERLLAALRQDDDRVVIALLAELAGIRQAGVYDLEVDPATGTSWIRSRDGESG